MTCLTSIPFVFFVYSYVEKHQIQLFGRGHIGGIDIKVRFCDSLCKWLVDVKSSTAEGAVAQQVVPISLIFVSRCWPASLHYVLGRDTFSHSASLH